MDKTELLEFAHYFFDRCQTLMHAKNNDYTPSDDAFGNFRNVEKFGIPTEDGFITRMVDKLSRIATFTQKGELLVKDESVQDTLLDLANYACLMAAYIEYKKEKRYVSPDPVA